MQIITYKLSGRGSFITSTLLVLIALVCLPSPRVRTARAEPVGQLAMRDGGSGEASPPSFSARPSRSLNGYSAGLPAAQFGRGDIPNPPVVWGRGGAKVDVKSIAKNGPLFAATYLLNDFNVTGFVKGGWPVVIEYELAAGSTATISVQHAKKPKKSYTIHLSPTNGEITEVKWILPKELGEKVTVGTFIVKAVKNGSDSKADAGFFLYGMGVGDEAVGSLVIDQDQFGPSPIHPKSGERTRYSFRALRPFNSVAVDFMVAAIKSNSLPGYDTVATKLFKNGISQGQVINEEWDGMNSKGVISMGVHRFVVRAWRGLKRKVDGDWTFRYAKDRVKVE
jgi:hypothetical protein